MYQNTLPLARTSAYNSEMTTSSSSTAHSACWGHLPLKIKHHVFIRQWGSSPHAAAQSAGTSPGALYPLCSCELSLCPPFCNGISTCGDKISFFPLLHFKQEDVCLEMSVSRSSAGILESKSSLWGNSRGKRRKLKTNGVILVSSYWKKKTRKERVKTNWKGISVWGQYQT